MGTDRVMVAVKWLFTRVGILYIGLFVALAFLVDAKAAASRVRIRRLNDARPSMSALVSLARGDVSPQAMDWKPYRSYFDLVLRYMPQEWTTRMFLGVAEYYQGEPGKAAVDLRASADAFPPLFWNCYNTAVLAFERGDMSLALAYLERAVQIPPPMAASAARSSVLYRQIMSSGNFDMDIEKDAASAREDVYLLIVAARYYAKDFAGARSVALQVIAMPEIRDKEPFYFYAGASSLSLGNAAEAMPLLGACLKQKSRNPWAYRYAGQILVAAGDAREGQALLHTAEELGKDASSGFPYSERVHLRFL